MMNHRGVAMITTTREIKSLFNASEWKLVEESKPGSVEKLTLSRVTMKITRARRLQDKWRDLSIKQARAAQEKDAAAASRQKAKIFTSVLKAFEKQKKNLLREAERAEAKKRKELIKKEVAAGSRKKNGPARGPLSHKDAPMEKKPGSMKTVGQVSARNKRNQAKRDSR
jgi:hypothetical protein